MNAVVIIELGRLRRPPSRQLEVETFESRMSIIATLIEMRKAGILRAIYCDNNRLAVVLPSDEDPIGELRQSISWPDAMKMAEEFERTVEAQTIHVEQKPPASAGILREAKAACRK